jgi:hypothetical protein
VNTLLAVVTLAVALLVPGWCLLSLLDLKALSLVLAIPASVGIGLAIVSVAAWTAWLTGSGMTGAAVLTLMITAGGVAARITWRKRAAPIPRPGRFELGAGALAAAAICIVTATGPWLGQSADTFYHMAAARTLLRENRAIPQDVFFGVTMPYPDATSGSLHLALAWLSLVGGMIPAWVALAIFGAALTALSFTAFTREVTGSTAAALIAAVLYFVINLSLDLRDAGFPDRIGLDLAWLSLTFLVRFAHSKPSRWRELAPACALGFTAASVYPGMAPFMVMMVMTILAVTALVALIRRDLRSVAPLAIACAAVLVVVLPMLAIRALAALPEQGAEATLATVAPKLPVIVRDGYPFVDFRPWFGTILGVATIGTACLLGRARRLLLKGDAGAALLWGGVLFVPVVAATPILPHWPATIYYLARFSFLLTPLLFITIGWELSALGGLLTSIKTRMTTLKSAVPLAAGLILLLATIDVVANGIATGPQLVYFGTGSRAMSTSQRLNLTTAWADRLRALDSAGPGTILAGLQTSYELAGLTGRGVVAVPRGHTPYEDEARDGALRRGDVAEALDPAANPTALLSVLFRYHVTLVMVDLDRDGQATWDWIAGQSMLTSVAEGSRWRLYRFETDRVDQVLDIPLTGGVGVFPSRVIAGRATFVRFTSSAPAGVARLTAVGLNGSGRYEAQVAFVARAGTVTVPLLFPDSTGIGRYSVTVSLAGTADLVAGQVEVGHAYEAEFFAGVIVELKPGLVRQPGWESVDGPAYGRGSAAVARHIGSKATHPLAEGPGAYCLAMSVFDNGNGRISTLDVGLGGAVTAETWGSDTEGVRELELAANVGTASRDLTYWVPTGARLGAIVDRITLYPLAPGGACKPGT